LHETGSRIGSRRCCRSSSPKSAPPWTAPCARFYRRFPSVDPVRDHVRKLLARSSWIAGAVLLAVLILYVGWDDVVSSIASITPGAVLAWIAITLAIRGILVLPLTLPIPAMGHTFPWEQAFWLTWARTFCNQIVPLS